MSPPRRSDTGEAPEINITQRSPSLKRWAVHWPLYAALTGSAMTMAPNVNPMALAASQGAPLIRALRRTSARRVSRPLFASVIATAGSQLGAPVISAGGIVPLDGIVNYIQPGEWVSIFGTNLAAGTAVWQGDFPTSLGGTSVEINGKAAYLSFVSPTQLNLQAPDDTASGLVSAVVQTSAGIASSTVSLSPYSPSFKLIDSQHVSAIILRPDGSGAFGNGAYDILGPTGNC